MSAKSLDQIMQEMAAQGITVNVTPAAGAREGFEDRPSGLIAEAAKRAGNYYERNKK